MQWIDQSQTVTCLHRLIACDVNTPGQKNWMITQYINITDEGVEQLTVTMTFDTAISVEQCPTCPQSFGLYSYETDVPDENGRGNQSFYMNTGTRFFHVQNSEEAESDTQDFLVSSKGLYLAVEDVGSCTRITRLYVFYYVCPSQVMNMVQYPETVSPPSTNPSDRTAIGTCIDNASEVSGGSLELDCNIIGNWEDNDLSCSCNPGYEIIMGACEGQLFQ